jgi:predicted negative regulator of RcsB-dependent stress response
MDKSVKDSADLMHLVAWAHANRQRLILTAAIAVAVGCIVGFIFWNKAHREDMANNALALLTPPTSISIATAADAEPYVRVANEYSGTQAGARAQLLAGQLFFDAGKFNEAQEQFQRFLADYPNNQLANQAAVGVAASLEAQGKVAEATARYEDIATRHAADSTMPQVKSALGRLYLAQNKPEKALQQYDELVRAANNDSWTSEAGLERGELLAKYPQLRKPVTPPPGPSPSSAFTLPMNTNAPPGSNGAPLMLKSAK